MKLEVTIMIALMVSVLHAQTINDPVTSGEDPSSLLDLPPVIVIDENSKNEPSSDDKDSNGKDEDEADGSEVDDTEADVIEIDTTESVPEIQIQVEKITGKTGSLRNDGKVKIEAPWPAKPISVPPTGWKFAPAPEGTEPFRTQVELTTGKVIELSITPYALVPVSDGRTSIKISEPGYKAALQYDQKDTLGVMLQNSTAEIEKHEKNAANAIQLLQELLSSLPREQ